MAYTVVSGDTLSGIAGKNGVSLSALIAANPQLSNPNMIYPGQQVNMPGGGGGGGAASPSADQYQTALSEYGAVATFAQSNPELNTLLQQAITNTWDAARFERELWKTGWYKSLTDQQRQLEVQQTTDPATFSNNIAQKAAQIAQTASQMGLAGGDWNALAHDALWYGWDNATLQARLVDNLGLQRPNDAFSGNAGEAQNHIRNTYRSFGIPISDGQIEQYVKDVVSGRQTIGGVDNQVIGMAQKLYPQYAVDFQEGRSLSDVARPYIQAMGTTLEVDPSAIDVSDPTIMKALHGDGANPTPMYAFQQSLKADPRWQKTDNAKNAAYDMVRQIGQDWGFVK